VHSITSGDGVQGSPAGLYKGLPPLDPVILIVPFGDGKQGRPPAGLF